MAAKGALKHGVKQALKRLAAAARRLVPDAVAAVRRAISRWRGRTLRSGFDFARPGASSLPTTGVTRFDELMVGTKTYDRWKRTMEKRGFKVGIDKKLDDTVAAQIDFDQMSIAVNEGKFRFLDLLHESRHVAQFARLEARDIKPTAPLRMLFEQGAYEYEMRLGKRFQFAPEYMRFAEEQKKSYAGSFIKKMVRDRKLQHLGAVLWR
jgi:hypothetical protein